MTECTLNFFGMRVRGQSPFIFILIPIFAGLMYLGACASLYAFAQMFGIVEFSWINGVYWAIVIATMIAIFGSTSK